MTSSSFVLSPWNRWGCPEGGVGKRSGSGGWTELGQSLKRQKTCRFSESCSRKRKSLQQSHENRDESIAQKPRIVESCKPEEKALVCYQGETPQGEFSQICKSLSTQYGDICAGVLSMDGYILDCNHNFSLVAGHSRENLINHSMLSITLDSERGKIFDAVSYIWMHRPEQVSLQTFIRDAEDKRVELNVLLRPMFDENNLLRGILWIGKPTQCPLLLQATAHEDAMDTSS